jgi:hypothetical protein
VDNSFVGKLQQFQDEISQLDLNAIITDSSIENTYREDDEYLLVPETEIMDCY